MAGCADLTTQLERDIPQHYRLIEDGRRCVLITPFLYPDNTEISIVVEPQSNGEILLTDEGMASDFAFLSGISQRSIDHRVRKVADRFAIDIDGGEISLTAPTSEISDAVVKLVSAIQVVGDLVYSRTPVQAGKRLRMHLESFLADRSLVYEKDVVFPGKTGSRTFDYHVTPSSIGPHQQLLLDVFEVTQDHRALERAKLISWDYGDVKSVGHDVPQLAVIVDDSQESVLRVFNPEVEAILLDSGSKIVLFSERQKLIDLAAA